MKKGRYFAVLFCVYTFMNSIAVYGSGVHVYKLKIIKSISGDENMDMIMERPVIIKEGAEGTFYVCDFSANQIFKFSEDGSYIKTIGNFGQGPGEFIKPNGLYYFNGKLVISEKGNMRVNIFDNEDRFLRSFKIANVPVSIMCDDSLLYSGVVKRTKNYKKVISIFNQNGKIIKKFGELQFPNNWLANLSEMLIYNNQIYELNEFVPRVRVFSKEGVLEKKIELNNKAYRRLAPENFKKENYKLIHNMFKMKSLMLAFNVCETGIYAAHYKIIKGWKGVVIDRFSFAGELMSTYSISELNSFEDFLLMEIDGKKVFYILAKNSGDIPGVYICEIQ